ncbi:MAG: DUF1015 domain-containing protein [Oscillospiraceae bacterium]|nr:DUF1015 domain-containing protein [Oscillospiraceae bacterium]
MSSTAFCPADILLPNENIDMPKWAVVACDQFTGEPEYWAETERIVGDSPSTLRLTLPEIYLGKPDTGDRIAQINSNIESYLSAGVFRELKNAMVYVRRIQSDGKLREGIVGAVDLEQYDYRAGSKSQIRATEATVAERIPPRLKIRENAKIELPHIMILIDDPERTVIEPLAGKTADLEKLYDFELMQGGGRISGYLLSDKEISAVDSALGELSKKCELLFAMGDGNHSLATAKEHYERLKRENPDVDMSNHPARYALCEIVNLHSPALEFEAIHRIVTGVNPKHLLEKMQEKLGTDTNGEGQKLTVVIGETEQALTIHNPLSKLAVGSLQTFLDEYLREFGGEIDYIHGEEVLKSLAKAENSVGFILEPMDKADLFPAVIHDGALPRKTFSMGHAEDKRYYLEARRIQA